jgi:hypothetical protein
MAKLHVSIGLLAVSLALLIIYGADAAAVSSSPDGEGFLRLDDAVRGMVFGGSAVIMSIVAFVIARKEPSNLVVALLFVNGALIIIGILVFAAGSMTSIASTVLMGTILIGLGAWKAMTDRRIVRKKEQAPK